MSSRIIGAIEIGTAKITVLVGQLDESRGLNIIGIGTTPCYGVMKGEIVDFDSALGSVHAAMLAAENSAGSKIGGVYLAQSGAHLSGVSKTGRITVGDINGYVTERDVERVQESAKYVELPDDRVMVHYLRSPYRLDDRITQSPIGHQGKWLEVRYWNVHGSVSSVRNHLQIINSYGVKVEDLILASLASARMVTDYRERLSGVLVLDIGRGTTDYALYKDGSVMVTGVVPVGGDHLTNDLAMGVRISVKQAESLKVNSGTADVKSCTREKQVMLVGDMSIGDRLIPQRSIALILEARVEELFHVVKEQLQEYLDPGQLPAGVVLTGGAARLHGIGAVAERVLGLPCRTGRNPEQVRSELRAPEFSTVLGLLHFGLDNMKEEIRSPRRPAKKGFFSTLAEMFRP